MEHTDSENQEIFLTENQDVIQIADENGHLVYCVVEKTPDKSGLEGTTDLIYNVVDQQRLCMGTSTDSQLIAGPSASVSLDEKGTVYQYTVPVSSAHNYQLPLGQGAKHSDKVLVERVNSIEQLPDNNLTPGISADMLNNNSTADIILASAEEPDLGDASTVQVQSYPSQDYGGMMSMPFVAPNMLTNGQTMQIPSSMEAAQILSGFNAEALESLQSLLDVDVDTTITTTTEELIGSAYEPATITISHENYNNSLQTNPVTQQRSAFSEGHGGARRSKRLTAKSGNCNQVQRGKARYSPSIEMEEQEEMAETKMTPKLEPVSLHYNHEYMNQEEVNMVKKSVSNFRPDFSSYPRFCKCRHKEKGTDIPVEQIWLHKNQMYYLPQINILVISYEEYVGFLRQEKWYVSVGEITQRLIPNFRNEVESYLVKNVCDKQFLSLEEIEYLKQRRCVNQNMKSGIMISLDTLRVMSKFLASTKAFIQAPTTGLSNAAHGIIYRKLFEQNSRCSKCGGAVEDIDATDRYVLMDSPVVDTTVQYPGRIHQTSLSPGTSLQKSMYVGEVNIGNVSFRSFKLDELTYISLKEIVECQVFNLQVLQSRLVQLQYRPRPAPTAIDSHFYNECVDVNQTLWIDLMTLRCACCMSRQRSPTSEIELLQQMFSRGQYTVNFNLEIIAIDDYDSANNETVYTLDPHSYKITTRHNYNQSVHAGASRKIQRSLSTEEEEKKETAKIVIKKGNVHVKPKTKPGNESIKIRSRGKPVLEPSHIETEESLSLKPGVYYFSDKNSIVDFLKNKPIDNTVQKDIECEVNAQKRSELPTLSKPVRFKVKSAPNAAPHLVRSGVQYFSQKRVKETKPRAAPKRDYKKKLKDLETDTNLNTAVRRDCGQAVEYCEDRTRKENDVSSSVPYYQDMQTAPFPSSQHCHDTYENYPSGPNSQSGRHHDHDQVKSPEVQDKNVDSTAAHNAEEELEYSHSQGGNCILTTLPSSTGDNSRDVDMQDTGNQNRDGEFLHNQDSPEDNCGNYSDNDFGEIEDTFSSTSTNVNGDTLHSVRIPVPENSQFSSPEPLNKMQDLATSTPQPAIKGIQRIARCNKKRRSSGSESLLSVHVHEQTRKLPFSSGHSPRPTQARSPSGDLSQSLFGPDQCDIEMAPDEMVKTGLLSPGYGGGIFSTPCVSPILDRKLDKKGNTQKMERLYNKCASLDTSTDADKSLHVLATVATDLDSLDETSSQSNISDRNDPCVFNSVLTGEFNKEKSVGTKVTMKRDSFVPFLGQLLDNVEIGRDAPSGKQIAVKFRKKAKRHFPALWMESGQTRLKKLIKLLARSVSAASPVEEVASYL